MAITRIVIDVPPDAVFAMLRNPYSYGAWVVGSKRIRGADPDWPAPGTAIHHTVGIGPFVERDKTYVRELDAPRRLVLEARAWPFGSALVDITLTPIDGGTELALDERPLGGIGAAIPDAASAPLTIARNAIALRRLKALVESSVTGREPGLRRSP